MNPQNYLKRADILYDSILRNSLIMEGSRLISYKLFEAYTNRVNHLANDAKANMPKKDYEEVRSRLKECVRMIIKARLISLKGLEETIENELDKEIFDRSKDTNTRNTIREILMGKPITEETIQKTL